MTFDYDYEYQGSASREVISPVCERVFVNLAMAFKDHFGAIISGPMVSAGCLLCAFKHFLFSHSVLSQDK